MLFSLLALLSLVAAAAAAVVPTTAARATDATTNVTTIDAWTYFSFGGNGSSTDPYSVTMQNEGCLIVSDAYCSGDQFAVAINGTDKGLTSTPVGAWCSVAVGDDVESALTKPEFSKGYYPLPPGTSTYNITVANTRGSGGAFYKVSSTKCPAPSQVVTSTTGANTTRATTNVTTIDSWTYFSFGANDTYSVTMQNEGCLIVSDAYCSGDQFAVAINGTNKGLTSTPVGAWCSVTVGEDVESALTKPEFSKGYYPLPPGTSTYNITVANTRGSGGAFYKISPTTCPAPPNVDTSAGKPASFKVVTSAGKVSSRAEAVSACEAAGMALADVTAVNLNDLADMVRKSPDIKLNPVDSVLVNSWNGDTYGNVDLQMTVSATTSSVMMGMGPAFPLCQNTTAS
ncbi:hypothetical protein GGF31_007478 [Allomyces arbusculus]|nr:hypothetical protein GGF31_007478 [Allomyces arbusculus]